MQTKYFTVEVKPNITVLSAGQHAAYADGDILFDWTAFDVPRGSCKLLGAHLEIRPQGDSGATPNIFPLELVFAKSKTATAPVALGAINSAASANTNLHTQTEHFVGHLPIVAGDFAATDSLAYASKAAPEGMVFEGEPRSGAGKGPGFNKLYVSGIAGGAIDFTSLTRINAGDLDGPTYTVNGTDPRLHLAVGDTLYATASGSAEQLIGGTVESMTDVLINMTSTGVELSNTDFIYNLSPIRIILAFEK